MLRQLIISLKPYKNPNSQIPKSQFSTSFLKTKTPKKFRKKRTKPTSPRTTPIQTLPNTIPQLEQILARDAFLRFPIRTKEFLKQQPERVLRLDEAGKLYQQLGFPRGRKVSKYLLRHPLLFEIYRYDKDDRMWVGFTEFAEAEILPEERRVFDLMERESFMRVRKLLMMCKGNRVGLSKVYRCRGLFGVPEDFRDRIVGKYDDWFRVVVEKDGTRVLELVGWDPGLAVSSLEREFLVDEEKVKRTFRFPVKYARELGLGVEDTRKLNLLNTLPLVSPYSDGWKLDMWSLEAEKYRLGVLHEFLSLTLEKRASIHHIVEFKEEFSLTKHTYRMLLRQPWAFYLAGTEMNWAVFLKDGYDENGVLKNKDPQVLFNEMFYKYADMKKLEFDISAEAN